MDNSFIKNYTLAQPLQLENATMTKEESCTYTSGMEHYLDNHVCQHCSNINPISNSLTIKIANGNKITSALKASLKMSHKLLHKAQFAHIFDEVHTDYFISTGRLCDYDCIAVFSKYNLQIVKNDEVIITSKRDDKNGLWDILLEPDQNTPQPPPSNPRQETENGILIFDKTKQ